MKAICNRAYVLGAVVMPGPWREPMDQSGLSDPLSSVALTLEPWMEPTMPIVMLTVLSAIGIAGVAWWGWRRWSRWRRIVERACPICRRHPDAEFVDCRTGDCVTGRIWQPGLPWPPRDEEESYV